jgi:hypothetical protein
MNGGPWAAKTDQPSGGLSKTERLIREANRSVDRRYEMLRNTSEKLRGPAVEAKGPRRPYFEGRFPLFTLLPRRGILSESKASLSIESSLKHTTHAVLPTFGLGSEEAPSIPWITSDQVQAPSSRARCRRCFGCEGMRRCFLSTTKGPGLSQYYPAPPIPS